MNSLRSEVVHHLCSCCLEAPHVGAVTTYAAHLVVEIFSLPDHIWLSLPLQHGGGLIQSKGETNDLWAPLNIASSIFNHYIVKICYSTAYHYFSQLCLIVFPTPFWIIYLWSISIPFWLLCYLVQSVWSLFLAFSPSLFFLCRPLLYAKTVLTLSPSCRKRHKQFKWGEKRLMFLVFWTIVHTYISTRLWVAFLHPYVTSFKVTVCTEDKIPDINNFLLYFVCFGMSGIFSEFSI